MGRCVEPEAGKSAERFLFLVDRKRDGRSAAPVLNPPDHVEIAPGTLLYYLADARIDSARVPWASLAAR